MKYHYINPEKLFHIQRVAIVKTFATVTRKP